MLLQSVFWYSAEGFCTVFVRDTGVQFSYEIFDSFAIKVILASQNKLGSSGLFLKLQLHDTMFTTKNCLLLCKQFSFGNIYPFFPTCFALSLLQQSLTFLYYRTSPITSLGAILSTNCSDFAHSYPLKSLI